MPERKTYQIPFEHEGSQYMVPVEADSLEEAVQAVQSSVPPANPGTAFMKTDIAKDTAAKTGKALANFTIGAAPMLAGAPVTVPTMIGAGLAGATNMLSEPEVASPVNAMHLASGALGMARTGTGLLGKAYEKFPVGMNMLEGGATSGIGEALSDKPEKDYPFAIGMGLGVGTVGGALSARLKNKARYTPTLISEDVKQGLENMSGPDVPNGPLGTLVNKFRQLNPAIEAEDIVQSGQNQLQKQSGIVATRMNQPPGTTGVTPPGYGRMRQAVNSLVPKVKDRARFFKSLKEGFARKHIQIQAADEMATDAMNQTGFNLKRMLPEEKDFIKDVLKHPDSNLANHIFPSGNNGADPAASAQWAKNFMTLVGGNTTQEAQALRTQVTKQLFQRASSEIGTHGARLFSPADFKKVISQVGPEAFDTIYGEGASKRLATLADILQKASDNMDAGAYGFKASLSLRGLLFLGANAGASGALYRYTSPEKAAGVAAGLTGAFLYQNFGTIAETFLRKGGVGEKLIRQYAENPDIGRGGLALNRFLQSFIDAGLTTEIDMDKYKNVKQD